ncbi:DUF3794 domain-containing protein [Haloimpatiens sp. FM7330]|uniref:DUF3794 domain-containing protein n=1 Tax=Haloimpatiens sp. FM7330 TaxID=3298610 RepID=UPI003636947D
MSSECLSNGMIEITGLCDTETIDLQDGDSWTQISVPVVLIIPDVKPDIEQVNSINISTKIIRKRVIETPAGTNEEGKILTGKKLIVEGLLCQTLSYTADVPEQSIHSVQLSVPFSAFIVVPADTNLDDNFEINACIEDVFIENICKRQVFENVTLLLEAVKVDKDC